MEDTVRDLAVMNGERQVGIGAIVVATAGDRSAELARGLSTRGTKSSTSEHVSEVEVQKRVR